MYICLMNTNRRIRPQRLSVLQCKVLMKQFQTVVSIIIRWPTDFQSTGFIWCRLSLESVTSISLNYHDRSQFSVFSSATFNAFDHQFLKGGSIRVMPPPDSKKFVDFRPFSNVVVLSSMLIVYSAEI